RLLGRAQRRGDRVARTGVAARRVEGGVPRPAPVGRRDMGAAREGSTRPRRGAALPGARHARWRARRARGGADRQPTRLARRDGQSLRVHDGALSRAAARGVGAWRRRGSHRGGRARRSVANGGGVTVEAPSVATRVVVSVPGGIGNIGPGLDVLGCAVAGLRDEVTAEWSDTAGIILLDAG